MVNIVFPQQMSILDLALILVLATASLTLVVMAFAIVRGLRPQQDKQEKPRQRKTARQEQQARILSNESLLDQALTLEFTARLRKGLKNGMVKPALVSDNCKGRVAYDFARQEWMCIEDDIVYPLYRQVQDEQVEYEDEEEAEAGSNV